MSKERWGEGFIYLRGKTWWIQYSVGGRKHRESARTTVESKAWKELRARLNKIERGEVVGSNIQRTTVKELVALLVKDYERTKKSAAWAKIVQKHLNGYFEFHKAARVGTAAIDGYIEHRRNAGISNATINRELALLRHAFYIGLRSEPPIVGRVPKIPKLPEGDARAGFFDRGSLEKLTAELPEELAQMARFAYWTGCRKNELLNMRWQWVDLAAPCVSIPKTITKSGEARVIPLVPELGTMLADMKLKRDREYPKSPWVFSRGGEQIRSFYASWRAAAERAGLKGSLLHDMRRSFVRNAVRAGVSERVAMAVSGHKTRSVFERYNIVSGADLAEAAKKLHQSEKEAQKEPQSGDNKK